MSEALRCDGCGKVTTNAEYEWGWVELRSLSAVVTYGTKPTRHFHNEACLVRSLVPPEEVAHGG